MTPPDAPEPGSSRTGTLAVEAALLLDVMADRLSGLRPDPAGAESEAAQRCPECGAVPNASCTACPLCRFLALIRGERPEAAASLVDGALLIVRGLRAMLPEPGPGDPTPDGHPPDPAAAPPGGPAEGTRPSPGRNGGLERIDIR